VSGGATGSAPGKKARVRGSSQAQTSEAVASGEEVAGLSAPALARWVDDYCSRVEASVEQQLETSVEAGGPPAEDKVATPAVENRSEAEAANAELTKVTAVVQPLPAIENHLRQLGSVHPQLHQLWQHQFRPNLPYHLSEQQRQEQDVHTGQRLWHWMQQQRLQQTPPQSSPHPHHLVTPPPSSQPQHPSNGHPSFQQPGADWNPRQIALFAQNRRRALEKQRREEQQGPTAVAQLAELQRRAARETVGLLLPTASPTTRPDKAVHAADAVVHAVDTTNESALDLRT